MKLKDKRVNENSLSFFQNLSVWQVGDVAKLTGYSVGTLYNLTSKNLIPHRKKRGKLYFIPVEIQNWIDEGDLR
ncbi:MAG: helix-turn-helix domain-containing protein [Bdellovibrionales bacterium]